MGKGVKAVQDLVPSQETLKEELLGDLKPMIPGRLCKEFLGARVGRDMINLILSFVLSLLVAS
jgi:hypothetical protein